MSSISHLYKQYIHGTLKKAMVQLVTVLLCHLTHTVAKGINAKCKKVYINTRAIKHLYDKRPAQEFHFLVENADQITKYPDRVYQNKIGKRGCYCFVKNIGDDLWLVSLEVIQDGNQDSTHYEVVTFFRTDENYLADFELLWKWEVGNPPS